MRKNMHVLFLFLLIISTNIAFGTGANKTKPPNGQSHAKHNTKPVAKAERIKRSLNDNDERPLYPQRAIKTHQENFASENSDENNNLVGKELPFWANRGRRDSSSVESEEYPDTPQIVPAPDIGKLKLCKNCYATDTLMDFYGNNIKDRRDELPFWGNRGRRSSEEVESASPFWGNRGRRQDSQEEPFWGARGRRQHDAPFWGNRGRREEEPFWGNRGRRDDEPFWGTRGRREDEPFWGNRGRREDAPFWGNRGRRDNVEPFWGNRGRRQESEPFWGNRGRRDDVEPFWGNRGRRKQDLKESILEAINDVQGDIENLSRLRRSGVQTPFWSSRPRDSKLKNLFSGPLRSRVQNLPNYLKNGNSNSKEPGTVHDNRIYAEEPHYILVERSSRSSAEDDPYFISRGKKYYLDLSKAARDRRGAIEEIVKSVRNDPYYIARGKKDNTIKTINDTASHDEFVKAKDLICSTIELITMKNEGGKIKRDVNDTERDRRTILKKLAAQLQVDPYFVSRGKKSDPGEDSLEGFITDLAAKCN